ncbi:FtsK/SpoIIIE domain-containing protein [Alicyclobacillus fastidiosus]|uniref:FtsK/SpoIIIE domain-containing protein n=1 Tax=Alicyclobacillus fastidiosus TaxID=392011 RepID=A0ABV5AIA7_9BACL|nr:FtsK/SpoIIIE domain-containing protein [Alicyclobacillus fastidiosus]WEH11120.1 FtsK/SpoIIIE domain-containing protein [Alicyclobacillus fastidiosus]
MPSTLKNWRIPIGKTRYNQTVFCNFNKVHHWKVAGATGSGKTEFLRYLVTYMCMKYSPDDVQFAIVDLKNGVSFAQFQWFPHVRGVYKTVPEAVSAIHAAHETMVERLQEVERLRAVFQPEPVYPRLIVLIDEGGELAPANAVLDEDKELRKAAMHLLSSVVRIGREPRVNIIYGTQRPDNDTLPVSIRGQMEGVFCFRTENELDSKIVLRHEGAEKLPWIPGRYLYKSPLVKYDIEVQSPYIPDKVLRRIIQPLIRCESQRTATQQSDAMCTDNQMADGDDGIGLETREKRRRWGRSE